MNSNFECLMIVEVPITPPMIHDHTVLIFAILSYLHTFVINYYWRSAGIGSGTLTCTKAHSFNFIVLTCNSLDFNLVIRPIIK